MTRAIAAGLAAAVLLLATGCGGAGTGDQPKVVTKQFYIAEADAVCAKISERLNTSGDADPQTPKQIVDAANKLADIYGDLRTDLRKLKAPSGAAARQGATAYIGAVDRTQTLVGQLRTSAQTFTEAVSAAKDRNKITATGNDVRRALDAFRAGQVEANKRALDYGFNICSSLT